MAADPLTAGLNLGKTLVDKFFTSDADKAKAERELLALAQSGELTRLSESAGIVKAEANSEHTITAVWRPVLMLMFGTIIANNYIIAPYLDAIFGAGITLELPPDMWQLIKIGVGGYVVSRGGEKITDKVMNRKSK